MWFKKPSVEEINTLVKGTMATHLGIEITEIGDDFLRGRMPVDHRTKQPYGILHGGASVVLAETIGSIASHCCVDLEKFITVGLEVNGNHLRQVHQGFINCTARPIHLGKKIHVWEIEIEDDKGKLVHVGRLTTAVIERK